jgi:DNA polymerase
LGKDFRVTKQRGQPIPSEYARVVLATVHPSFILRAPKPEERHAQLKAFIQDLRVVAEVLRGLEGGAEVSVPL